MFQIKRDIKREDTSSDSLSALIRPPEPAPGVEQWDYLERRKGEMTPKFRLLSFDFPPRQEVLMTTKINKKKRAGVRPLSTQLSSQEASGEEAS